MIFTDESKFQTVNDSKTHFVHRKSNERLKKNCIRETIKFPPSVMVWGCFTASKTGPLIVIEGTLNSEKYINMLNHIDIQELDENIEFFQQDNAPCHKSKK